jgi:hypothetical protein
MRSSNRSFPLLSKVYRRAGSSIGLSAIASCSAPTTARSAPAMPSASALKRVSGLISRVNATETLSRGEARQYEIGPLAPDDLGLEIASHRKHAGPREEPPQGLDEGVPACGVVVRNQDHRHAPSVLRVAEEPSRTMVGCLGIRGGFR